MHTICASVPVSSIKSCERKLGICPCGANQKPNRIRRFHNVFGRSVGEGEPSVHLHRERPQRTDRLVLRLLLTLVMNRDTLNVNSPAAKNA
jgi:hypothetical protein